MASNSNADNAVIQQSQKSTISDVSNKITDKLAKKGSGKTATGQKPNPIDINPKMDDGTGSRTMSESKESTAVMAFGRYNPPTTGHEKLINKVKDVAKEHNGQAHIVASHSEGTSKDPLPQKKKLEYLKKVGGEGVHVSGSSKAEPSIFHSAAKLHSQGHKHLVVVAGSDRVDEYKEKLEKYNNVEGKHGHYNFKSIKVVSAGHRDPDAEGAEGMSGTKMREHARAGKKKEFKSGLPKALHPHADEIIHHIQSIKESADELFERVLTLVQRRQRAMQMKRLKSRLSRARKFAANRMATQQALERRAAKKAKNVLRVRYAGQRGAHYQQMSPSDKMSVDRVIDPKVKNIKRMALRLVPKIRQAEIKRLEFHRMHKKAPTQKIGNFMSFSYEHGNGEDLQEKELLAFVGKVYDTLVSNNLTEQEQKSLDKKAEKSKIPFYVISEVYKRGVEEWKLSGDTSITPQQAGFNRVNSFLNKGDTFYNEDSDLAEQANPKAKKVENQPAEVAKHTHTVTMHLHDPLNPGIQARIVKDLNVQADSDEAAAERARKYYEVKGFKKMVVQKVSPIGKKSVKEAADPTSHETAANKLQQQGKPMLASIHRKIAMALRRGDKTSAKATQQELQQKKSSLNENFIIDKPAGMGTTYTAKDLGMKMQGAFAYHPSVEEELKDKIDHFRAMLKQIKDHGNG